MSVTQPGGKSGEEDDLIHRPFSDPETQYADAIIAASFANLELVSVKKTLSQSAETVNRVNAENARLREQMNERDRDALQVIEFLRIEVEKKHKIIEEGIAKQAAIQAAHEEAMMKEAEKFKEELLEKDHLLDVSRQRIQELEDEIESIIQFKRQKQDLAEEMHELRQELVNTKERYEKELSRTNFTALEERVRLKSEKKEFLDRFSQEVNSRAMELLDEKTRSIYDQNRKLILEKRELEREVQSLNTHMSEHTGILTEKVRELDLAQQSHRMISKQGYRFRKELQQLSQRNTSLEESVRKVAEKYEQEIQKLEKQSHETIATLTNELNACKQDLMVRTRDLRRVRSLARAILQQRSELESFFYEAIAHAKEQKEMHAAVAAGRGGDPHPQHDGNGMDQRPRLAGSRYPFEMEPSQAKPRKASISRVMHVARKLGPPRTTRDRAMVCSSTSLPPIETNPSMTVGTVFCSATKSIPKKNSNTLMRLDGSDFSELTWEDKEHVLRFIFAKINSVASVHVDGVGSDVHRSDAEGEPLGELGLRGEQSFLEHGDGDESLLAGTPVITSPNPPMNAHGGKFERGLTMSRASKSGSSPGSTYTQEEHSSTGRAFEATEFPIREW